MDTRFDPPEVEADWVIAALPDGTHVRVQVRNEVFDMCKKIRGDESTSYVLVEHLTEESWLRVYFKDSSVLPYAITN